MCSNNKVGTIKSLSAPPSPTSSSSNCASGHILLVSMQKLRNPAFQRFGADLRKTLMITSVVKQARKFYQLGSDVPVNCGCIRADSMFALPVEDIVDTAAQTVEDEETSTDCCHSSSIDDDQQQHQNNNNNAGKTAFLSSESRQQVSRKHSLSPFRKSRGPKVSYIVPVDNNNKNSHPSLPHSRHRHNNNHDHYQEHQHPAQHQINYNINSHNSNSNAPLQEEDQPRQQTQHQQSAPRLHVAIAPAVARYFHQLHPTSDDTPPIKKRRLAFVPHEPNAICITATVC